MKLGLISNYKVEKETNLGYTISDESGNEYSFFIEQPTKEEIKDFLDNEWKT